MPQRQTYLREAQEYYEEQAHRFLGARVHRNLIVKGTTLLALGGSSAVAQILAACASGAQTRETVIGTSAEGAYKYSKYPFVEKYNFRNLPWPSTPYLDAVHHRPQDAPQSWDVFTTGLASYATWLDTLRKKRYGAGANMLNEELQDNLASVSIAPDYSYYDYKIFPGIHFHDIPPVNGRQFTAEDAAYSIERYTKNSIHSASLTVVDRVEVLPDKQTMRIYVKRPINFLDHILASNDYYMVAREHAEGDKSYFQQQPIGTGPFKVIESKRNVGLSSVRHERFGRQDSRWAGYQLPFMKEVRNIYMADANVAKAAFRSGQVDYRNVIMDLTEFEDLLTTNPDSVIQVHAPNSNYGNIWGFNMKTPPLNDVRVRRALNMALNRQQMIEVVWGGLASGSYPIGYPFQGYTDPLHPDDLGPWYRHDLAGAKELLRQAGYPDGFEMEYMHTGTLSSTEVVAMQHLEQIGVRVKPTQVESAVLTANRLARKFTHAISSGRSDATGWTGVKNAYDFFSPDSPRNVSEVNDPVLSDLIDQAAASLDADQQVQLLRKINERSLDQAYYLETVTGFYIFFRRPWLHNVASAVQGQFCCWGTPQNAVAWIDDSAPEGRRGRLRA